MKTALARLYRLLPPVLVKAAVRLSQPKFIVSAVGVFFDPEGRALVLRHVYRHRQPWGLPAGFLETGEAPRTGILRELREETGLEAETAEVFAVTALSPRHLEIALVGAVSGHPDMRLNHEIFEAVFAGVADLPAEMPAGQKDLVRRAAALRSASGPSSG